MRSSLKPGLIPEPGALLVNNTSPEMLVKSNLSHYSMIKELSKKLSEWSPAIFMGYALKKKIRMISRIGNNKIISIRNINSVKNFHESRWKYDKKFFYIIKKNHKSKAIKIGNKILEDRLKGRNQPDKDIDIEGIKLAKIRNIKFVENYNKKMN